MGVEQGRGNFSDLNLTFMLLRTPGLMSLVIWCGALISTAFHCIVYDLIRTQTEKGDLTEKQTTFLCIRADLYSYVCICQPPQHIYHLLFSHFLSIPRCIPLSVRVVVGGRVLRHRQDCAHSANLITNSVRSEVSHSGAIYNYDTLCLSAAVCQQAGLERI